MAYGKIKADTFVYDNSGSDVEVTLSSLGNKANLNSPTFTGTPVVPGYAPLAGATFTGNVVMSANLTVQGTTTTISSTTINVADKNIEIGKVNTPTDTTADGGGITLKGATDKTWNWVDATDAWTSSEHIHLGDDKQLLFGASSDLKIYHDQSSGQSIIEEAGPSVLKIKASDFRLTNTANSKDYIQANDGGAVKLFHNGGSAKFETTTAGVTVTGTVSDSKGDLRKIVQNTQGSAYTLVASDAGKHINTGAGVTVPNSVFAAGDAVTICNASGNDLTITQGSGLTMHHAGTADTGNRTLAQRGVATMIFTGASKCYLSGAGLS